jgi:hypothetical protein
VLVAAQKEAFASLLLPALAELARSKGLAAKNARALLDKLSTG